MKQGPMAEKGRHTRTRNGCQRCRTKRRKCDEAKPQCQRCVDAGAPCNYVKPFLFRNQQGESHNHNTPQTESLSQPRQPENDMISLLQYYQRHVAPWLDLFDKKRAFGRLVPRFWRLWPSVLNAVLQLVAATFPDLGRAHSNASGSAPSALQALGNLLHVAPDPNLPVIVEFSLKKAQLFVETSPDSWESVFPYGGADPGFGPHSLNNPDHNRIYIAFGILLCRLSLAHALIHEVGPAVDSRVLKDILETVQPSGSGSGASSAEEEDMEQYECLACLGLAIDVTVLCFDRPPNTNDQKSSSRTTSPRDEIWEAKWKTLRRELRSWHRRRPVNFHPSIEADNRPNSAFPTVLFFSDDAGACVNMMYHVAMYILLSHRPKSSTVSRITTTTTTTAAGNNNNDRNDAQDEEEDEGEEERMHMSSLWHAQRLCSISLSTDQQCWDPCMIAAFWLCARRMTHPGQQREILGCLGRLSSSGTGGWRRVSSLVDRLRDEFVIRD